MKTGIVIGIFVVLGLLAIQAATVNELLDAHNRIDALEDELRSSTQLLERNAQETYNEMMIRDAALGMKIDVLRDWISDNFYGVR